jgi:hypothetical protein
VPSWSSSARRSVAISPTSPCCTSTVRAVWGRPLCCASSPRSPAGPLALSEPEFTDAVRHALKNLRRPDLLAQSPLLRSRCLRDRSEQEPTPALLQATLREGIQNLLTSPKTQKLHRVLWHSYCEPAPTQEVAAELLNLPFSTYRHQLGRGVEQLVAWLWQQEVYGVDS